MSEENSSIFEIEARKRLGNIARIILVGSGKGGVGKSLVSCALALNLSKNHRTAILDLDIHGATLLNYLQVQPPLKSGEKGLIPAEDGSLKVMSIALFTGNNAVPLRGDKKQKLITELFSLTDWGKLDYLVVDLPPSTGDELLSAFKIFSGKCELVLVTTPALNAQAVVMRLRQLAESEKIPVKGIVVNMAYMKQQDKKVQVFGKLDKQKLERELRAPILAEIPIDLKINSEKKLGKLIQGRNSVAQAFNSLTAEITREKSKT